LNRQVTHPANWYEVIKAVNLEIKEAQKHSQSYDLHDGQLIDTDPSGWLYRFFFEHDIPMPEGTEGAVSTGKSAEKHQSTVLSYAPPHLFLLVENYLGQAVGDAQFHPQAWKVLSSLLEMIEEELIPRGAVPFLPEPEAVGIDVFIDSKQLEEGYNFSQTNAAVVAASGRATAIWGPPGTGKTKTLGLVLAYLLQKGERTLLIAPSNTAVDQAVLELTTLLEKYGLTNLMETVMRYGFPVQSGVRDHSVVSPKAWISRLDSSLYKRWQHLEQQLRFLTGKGEASGQKLKTILSDLAEVRHLAREVLKNSLPQVRCLATTVAMAVTDKTVREAGRYSLLAVDEASMVGLAFLLALHPLGTRLTLFGDFRQLPPVTASDAGPVRQWLGTTGFDAWSISRFVEQANFPKFLQMLRVQYRMHPDLSRLVSRFAYKNRLEDDPATASIREREGKTGPFPGRAVVIANLRPFAAEACRPSGGSRWNDLSATLALGLAYQALVEGHNTAAVITPYKQQARLLYRMLKDLGSEDRIRLGTVHRFQGSQEPFVVIDFVEANRKRQRWAPFFEDDLEKTASRLVTVAISRAQVRTVLLADWTLLNSVVGPSVNSPLRRILSEMPGCPLETVSLIPKVGKVSAKIFLFPPSADVPPDLLISVQQAKSRVVLHWPTKEAIKKLPNDLHDIIQAVYVFIGKRPAGQVLLSPHELRLSIPGAQNVSMPVDPKVEIPSSPVIAVDDDVWWHKTPSGYWLGFLKMSRTVRILLELTGWGLTTISTGQEGLGESKREVTWSIRLCCGRCKAKVGIEWRRASPVAVCYSCKQDWPATANQVEEFLSLLKQTCKCGRAYRVKQSSSGSWGAVCSGGCQGWNNLRQLLE
jgi:hypothetical protein